ncbi:MAG: hypothetical protein KDE19_07455 [Caldilineaceae bacterium]|nr:hypothetical protein [Caldilineaceae bacterium]
MRISIIPLLIIICGNILSGCVQNFHVGTYTVTDVYVTNKLDAAMNPVPLTDQDAPIDAIHKIWGVVKTTGIDGPIGIRWIANGETLLDQIVRTENNQVVAWIDGSLQRPIVGGDYRFEVIIPPDTIKEVVTVTIPKYIPDVVPPQPTPEDHVDLEGAPFLEVPFAFDEVWEIEGHRYKINEVKIVFLQDVVLMAVVVEVSYDIKRLSEERADEVSKPIAIYAVQEGYLQRAKSLMINGEDYNLEKNITVTLYNPVMKGGYRQQYDLDQLNNRLVPK